MKLFNKQTVLFFTLLSAFCLPLVNKEKVNNEEVIPAGLVAYAASYSGDPASEPQYSTQYNKTFQYLNLGKSLKRVRGNSVKVGIIDSGINYDHEDFMVGTDKKVKSDSKTIKYENYSWKTYSCTTSSNFAYLDDSLGHGTNVAATVAAALNGVGGLGLAPNVELYVYKVTNDNNGYEFEAIRRALNDAISLELDVINMSFQSYENAVSYGTSSMAASTGCSTALSTNLNNAYNSGITLVAAAGNFNTDEPSYPGSNSHVINVGSLNQTGTDKAGFSNYGSTIDLVAPGYVHVAEKGDNDAYKDTQGTSFSAPLVTAAIALYKQKYPNATPSQIEAALYASCDEIDDSGSIYSNWAGHGALNLEKFLDLENAPVDLAFTNEDIDDDMLLLETGDQLQLTYAFDGNGTYDHSVKFALTEDNGTLSIDANGKITALAAGTDMVTVTSVADPGLEAVVMVMVDQGSQPSLNTISVGTAPTKVSYDVGNKFNPAGLVIRRNYVGGTYDTYTYSGHESEFKFTPSLDTELTASDTSITIRYGGRETTQEITVSGLNEFTDTITKSITGASGTSYSSWSNKSPGDSDAIYAGNNAGGNNSIQLRSTNNSGIITTTSGGLCSKVTIDWNSNTSNGKVIQIYGKNSAYTAVSDLYSSSSSTKGELLGTITYGTSTELTISGKYEYVGIKSSDGAIYVNSVTFTWLSSKTPPPALDSISLSGNYKTIFEEGDTFSFGGVVTAHYTNGGADEIVTSSAVFSDYDLSTPGNQTVTVSVTKDNVTKTTSYSITVNAGVLSSISVNGQTTSYLRNSTFSFDGTCTATFTSGNSKVVTPTDVTTPDMTTDGKKTVTVTYSYNNKTETTSYEITVYYQRTVTEEAYSVVGTVTYTSGSEVVSTATLSTSKSGYTLIENAPDSSHKGLRLGSGSNKGTLTITSTTSNIFKVVVNARVYSSDSGVSMTIGGTSNTLTSSYADYTKEYTSATNSVAIATTSNGKRAWISKVTIYTKSIQDISDSEDCVGLESFINDYMHMDYTQNLGYCKDNEHHYYSSAKAAFNALNNHQRTLFTSNSAYTNEWNRLSTWATMNGDALNSNTILASGRFISNSFSQNNDSLIMILTASVITISIVFGYVIFKRQKTKKPR